MKELINSFKRDFLLLAVVELVAGILLLVYPDNAVKFICYICAGILLIYGLLHLISYFTHKISADITGYDLVQGIIGIAVGTFILASPEFLANIIIIVLGVSIIFESLIKLQNSFDLARMNYGLWWLLLIFAIATCVLGVLILVNPFETASMLMMFIGISLIVNAVIDFWNIFFVSKKIRNLKAALQDAKAIEIKAEDVIDE